MPSVRVRARVGTQAMKAVLVFVLALSAIAYGQRLPFPEALKEKIPEWSRETPVHIQRIIGGTAVSNGGRPFQILLARSGSFTCGGSLIANNKVLTAAHCVYGQESSPSTFSIRYNTLTQSGGQSITVSRISRHAQYNSGTIDYDVAVLTLASNISPGTNAALVTLASSEPSSGAAVVSGWGRTSGGGSVSQNLLQTTLNVVARTTCQSTYGSINTITARMLCANASGKGSCNGDSGGPLTNSAGQQIGVVSWGVSGCLTTYPSVFANVPNLRSWITSQ